MNNEATRAQLRRVPLAGALTVALLGAGALSVFAPTAPAASAAEVNGIITSASVRNEFSPNGPNRLWDSFSADLTFDTTGKSVKQGDTLTIDLPAELRTRNATFDVTDKKTGGVALNCTVPFGLGQTVTCTFTDYVNTHVNAKGDIHVRTDMASTTTDASLTFKINHKVEIKADIPNGNVVVNKESWVPPSPWKYGWQLHDGHNERFTWEIHIPAKS
ncbi:MAG: Ig-like domain-containing protein, partial [Dermabacter sp.]|nr:Ig-like domain-containing protein [Dermabacter sp.]